LYANLYFSDMIRMADLVTAWFEENEKNVIAVHCKGGKGRTGTMISVALLKSGVCQTPEVSLAKFRFNFFARRTNTLVTGVNNEGSL
jgi:protein-tyrosine phosphatase